MRKSLKYVYLVLGTIGVLAAACTKDRVQMKPVTPFECLDSLNYVQDIGPIIEQNCSTTDCHDAMASGGYVLNSYASVHQNASIILQVIKHEPGVTAMPFASPKLPDSLIQKVECWIMQGKPEN